MLNCRLCEKEFDPETDGIGHIDDHIEVCMGCYPKFREMVIKESIAGIGKHLTGWYRKKRLRGEINA
jgi:hypothetical protein